MIMRITPCMFNNSHKASVNALSTPIYITHIQKAEDKRHKMSSDPNSQPPDDRTTNPNPAKNLTVNPSILQ